MSELTEKQKNAIAKTLDSMSLDELLAHIVKHPEDLEFYKGEYIPDCINALYDTNPELLVKLGLLQWYVDPISEETDEEID